MRRWKAKAAQLTLPGFEYLDCWTCKVKRYVDKTPWQTHKAHHNEGMDEDG